MTSTLIVLAHPDPHSFNASWSKKTETASNRLGHNVLWSNLCTMQFDPVEKQSHYKNSAAEEPFDVLKAQETAAKSASLPADVAVEIDKIRKADRIIFHFPIWWFAPPAILKGWCDRVLANGALHSTAERFDSGQCRDKKALFCVTTGSRAEESQYNGKEGDVHMLLWPLAYTLRYLGFTVLEPRIVHGVHGYNIGQVKDRLQARLTEELENHETTINDFDSLAMMRFNVDADFGEDGRLRPCSASHSHFIRHAP